MKGMWKGERRVWFLPFSGGIPRSSLPSNNLSARPTDLLSAHERISVTNHFPSTYLAERISIQTSAVPGQLVTTRGQGFLIYGRGARVPDPSQLLFSRKKSAGN